MNFSRRELFTRLSAIALAPLVKWLPKESYPWCEATYVSSEWQLAHDEMAKGLLEALDLTSPIPQEEA